MTGGTTPLAQMWSIKEKCQPDASDDIQSPDLPAARRQQKASTPPPAAGLTCSLTLHPGLRSSVPKPPGGHSAQFLSCGIRKPIIANMCCRRPLAGRVPTGRAEKIDLILPMNIYKQAMFKSSSLCSVSAFFPLRLLLWEVLVFMSEAF